MEGVEEAIIALLNYSSDTLFSAIRFIVNATTTHKVKKTRKSKRTYIILLQRARVTTLLIT